MTTTLAGKHDPLVSTTDLPAARTMNALRRLKGAVVSMAAWALFVTGLLHVLVHFRLRRRAVVLMYHRVIDVNDVGSAYSSPGIVVEKRTFERQLRTVRKLFRVVSIDEFRTMLASGRPLPSRTCLITFDDGWADNHANAFPLLGTYGLPATVFLPSGYIGTTRRFWQETVSHALHVASLDWQRARQEPALARFVLSVGLDSPIPTTEIARRVAVQDTLERLKRLPRVAREELVRQAKDVLDRLGASREHIDKFLTWEQVREMAVGNVRFGSHAVSHELLTSLTADQARAEIHTSKREIERQLGREIDCFSYPNGNHDAALAKCVSDGGFALAFTTEPGLVKAGDDPFRLQRVNVHERATSNVALFLARIVGMQ